MNNKMKLSLPSRYSGKLISSLAFLLCIWGQGIQPSWAEGSKELVSNGGYRPYLEWANGKTASILRQTTLQVYVNAGETVNLGSSVPTSSNSNGTQDIVYKSPFGGQNGSCDVLSSGYGLIDTVAKETVGPFPNAGGYTPCFFVAKETGVYKVEFRAPSLSGDPSPILAKSQFAIDSTQNSGVAAWDITVTSGGIAQTGRVFANYIALNMGSNGIGLNSQLYIQTKDGYRYQTEMNGIDPFGFIFFANSRGYIDKTNNSTLYHSAAGATDNALNFSGNVRVQDPSIADTPGNITHYIFLNRSATATLNALGVPVIPVPPAVPQNFLFTGGSGGSGNQTFVGVGGNFSFKVLTSGYYQIIIDTNGDGIFDPSTDRVLQNVMSAGQTVVSWDGKDASGVPLQPRPGNQPYSAQITTRSGEYHFPLLDAEYNTSGVKITMENPPSVFPDILDQNGTKISAATIYYNDSNYTTADGTFVSLDGSGASNPRNAARGIDSSNPLYRHSYSNNYGDFKGMDTWTFFPSQAIITPLVITSNKTANVQGTKSVRFLTDNDNSGTVSVGDTVEYTIIYSNLSPGNSDATNFVITDNLPSQITYQSAAITSATSGNTIALNNSYTGTGALTNSGTLRVGDTITIKITAKINNNNSGQPISNQASANFNTPDNSATVGNVLTDAVPTSGVTNPPTVGNNFLQTADDGIDTGNDPSKSGDDDPTLFTVSITPTQPKLLLVKRITRINNQNYNSFVDGRSDVALAAANYVAAPKDIDDNDPKWPSNYLQGLINAGTVKPGDELEYTIYFLSNGLGAAKNVKFCDLVPSNVTFIPTAFNGLTPNDGGLSTADQGIALAIGSSTPTVYLSNVADTDRGTFYSANDSSTPTSCGSNTNGAIVVNITNSTLTSLPPATGVGTPANSYGFVRFRGQVK